MPITYKKTVALLEGHCEIEEAETLFEWLLNNPKGKINLKQLRHLHAAVLQVIMALNTDVSAWPVDESVLSWLRPALAECDDS